MNSVLLFSLFCVTFHCHAIAKTYLVNSAEEKHTCFLSLSCRAVAYRCSKVCCSELGFDIESTVSLNHPLLSLL